MKLFNWNPALYKHVYLASILVIGALVSAFGQINGKVTNTNDEALAFASIYISGTSKGTTSNLDGEFKLNLDHGKYDLVFQYVGYKKEIVRVEVDQNPQTLYINLIEESYTLSEVTISASAEDPAYAIMRKAIEKREYFLHHIESYECDVYIKGNQNLLNAPEKILGQELGDLDGTLDSNRQGIVYLSESIAKYYYKVPDQRKEVMISSKISGNDRGYSFNSATELEANFYENTLEFNRALVSPIASNAMNYYEYKLVGAKLDEDGRLINKIQVIPKRKYDPVVYGDIYIIEDHWNIQSLELKATPAATQLYFIDSLTVKQVYVPVGDNNQWAIFTNTISFDVKLFGFELEGQFNGVYTNYNLNPSFPDDLFNADVFVVEKESNKKDEIYWDENRPVPLLVEERKDYVRRDSIQEIRESPEYMDSTDRENNKWKILHLLGRYQYRKTTDKLTIDIESPIMNTSLNTVQGFHTRLEGRILKYLNEEETKRVLFWPKLGYGFSDKQCRGSGRLEYRFNRLKYARIGVEGGRDAFQYNRQNPISGTMNAIYSLFLRRNYMKLHDSYYGRVYGQYEISDGIMLRTGVKFAKRKPLVNHSDYSFASEDKRVYSSNDPQNPKIVGILAFESHEAFTVETEIRFRFSQKYYKYPDFKFPVDSRGPELRLNYKAAIDAFNTDISYHLLEAGISDEWFLGAKGNIGYTFSGGYFLSRSSMEIMDYKHFNGHEILFTNPSNYLSGFLLLPYYRNSTDQAFFQFHTQYKMKGWILNRIPGVNALGLSLVAGAKYLYTSDNPHYWELHVGIDQIGLSFLRVLRIDFVASFEDTSYPDFGIRLGFSLGNN